MSLKTLLVSRIAEHITGLERQQSLRARAERRRLAAGEAHVVDYFHQVDDPYSCLMTQALPLLAMRYDVQLRCHLVSPPADWAAPERAKLQAWSRKDGALLARKAGLGFSDNGMQPGLDRVAEAEAGLAKCLRAGRIVEDADSLMRTLWSGDELPVGDGVVADGSVAAAREEGDGLRAKLGHYLGATLHYGGEWYWGLDRLHFLEERLAALGARKAGAPEAFVYQQPPSPACDARRGSGGQLHFYLSFRSPYTYIAAERAKALADAYGIELKLRFVLPMVMRGLPVPPTKRNYITLDAAREARRVGVPFGRVVDPLGKPVERGYALLPWARSQGRGFDYALAFMRAVWSQGIDAGSDAGMRRIVDAAGLDWQAARPLLLNNDWRTEAEANRQELTSLGLWGVPCFRFGEAVAWGQDRLWVIEDAIRSQQARA